jgi:DNA-binding GntR family transcriptional regulator
LATGSLQFERVYQEIKTRIIYGGYHPGAVLSESTLARVHRSSRTPVREALSRLLEEGYVERVPHRGYTAAPLTLAAIENTFEVRRLLEGTAAARAAERAELDQIARLDELAEYPQFESTAESYRARLSANTRFHLAVAAASGNGFLVDVVGHCLAQHDRVLSLGVDFALLTGSVDHHHAIVTAIKQRRPAEARRLMEEHLDASHRLVRDFLLRGRIRGVDV